MTLTNLFSNSAPKIIPAAGDGQTIIALNKTHFPAILLDAALTTQTLLGEDNQGLLSLSEYAKFLRDMRLKSTIPLIADLQSGFGSPLNTYHAAQELERSGGAILLLNDQHYPAHSTTQPQTITPADLLGKTRAAKDGLTNPATQLWIKLEGLWDYGITGANKRIHYLENAGADAILIDHSDMTELQALTSSDTNLPLLATWTPATHQIDGISGWIDTGQIAREAELTRQTAINKLTQGEMTYAKK